MQRYWDLSEKERSELTSERVDAMLVVELMEKGVTKVSAPELLPVEPAEIPKTRFYTIKAANSYNPCGVAYETIEAASAAMAGAIGISSRYVGDQYVNVREEGSISVESIDICKASDVMAAKSQNDKAAANKKANDKALSDYNAACKAVDDACDGVWEDWNDCRAKAAKVSQIMSTLAEYTAICDGDGDKALVFLGKTFGRPAIEVAFQFAGKPDPYTRAVKPAVPAAEDAEDDAAAFAANF